MIMRIKQAGAHASVGQAPAARTTWTRPVTACSAALRAGRRICALGAAWRLSLHPKDPWHALRRAPARLPQRRAEQPAAWSRARGRPSALQQPRARSQRQPAARSPPQSPPGRRPAPAPRAPWRWPRHARRPAATSLPRRPQAPQPARLRRAPQRRPHHAQGTTCPRNPCQAAPPQGCTTQRQPLPLPAPWHRRPTLAPALRRPAPRRARQGARRAHGPGPPRCWPAPGSRIATWGPAQARLSRRTAQARPPACS